MKVLFEKITMNGNEYYHHKSNDLCDCLKNFGDIIIGENYDSLTYKPYVGVFIDCSQLEYQPYEDDPWMINSYKKINFCPICGEKIEVIIADGGDKTAEYEELEKMREEVWKECKNTDSKSRERELLAERDRLDDLINAMYGETFSLKEGN